jgi:hypothetical protein
MLALGVGAILTSRHIPWPDFGPLSILAAGMPGPSVANVLNQGLVFTLRHLKTQTTGHQMFTPQLGLRHIGQDRQQIAFIE